MKLKFLKVSLFFSIIALSLSSCLKDDLQEPKIIIEPEWWPYSVIWQETERKIGTADWEIIPNGNRLALWGSYSDTSKTVLVGKYKYYPANLGIDIDTAGYMQMKDNTLSFMTITKDLLRDTTATVAYVNTKNTSFVIRNTSVEPNIEIRYKIIDHYITPEYTDFGSLP